MFSKADNSFSFAIAAALVLFFLGGILTTIVPPMVDKSWGRPFENHDPAKGPTGKLQPYTAQQLKGRAIYVREGCWYCHTQQTRTLVADTIRSGWRRRMNSFTTIRTCSAPNGQGRTCRASVASTTRSGIVPISAIHAILCQAR